MSRTKNPTAWDLFHRCFKPGDQVFVIDDNDKVHWGQLGTMDEDTFKLTRPGGLWTELHWWDIRWISHDGFPVRQLFGADGSASIEAEASVMEAIRQAHVGRGESAYRDDLGAAIARTDALTDEVRKLREDPPIRTIYRGRFGDPFDFEDVVHSELFNPGNVGWRHFLTDTEECLVLTAKDGAKAQLFDLPTVYYVEFAHA